MSYSTRAQDLFFTNGRRLHLLFCLALLFIPALVMLATRNTYYIPFALFSYLFVLGGIYAGRSLCRRWLLTGRWTVLMGALLLSLAGFAIIGTTGFILSFNPEMHFNHIVETAINMTVVSFLLLLAGFVITVTRSAIREKLNGLLLAEQKKQSELGLLRSQVSPHFLFNTLHNLYSLSLNRPSEMPDLLLRLAELLRYAVYEAELPLVNLREEIAYLRNYVALEKIRMSDRLILTLDLDESPAGVQIAPMLLIVFLENAFKHGRDTFDQTVTITVLLKVMDGKIYFSVINSCAVDVTVAAAGKMGSGFGIANVVKRLDLLYPGEYGLKQNHTADQYQVELWLIVK